MKATIKDYFNFVKIPLLISVATYFVFFAPLLYPNNIMFKEDLSTFFYPFRSYIYENLRNGRFPFWTERIFSGFPIYAEPEAGFLNPVSNLLIYLLGPFMSYKLFHFVNYLVGSISFYLLLKRKGHSALAFFVANAIYFFSFFILFHQQHIMAISVSYLIPLNLLLTDLYLDKKEFKYLLTKALTVSFSLYFGTIQYVLLSGLADVLFVAVYYFGKVSKKFLIYYVAALTTLFLIFSFPALYSQHSLYIQSNRAGSGFSYTQGSFTPLTPFTFFYPFVFGIGKSYVGNRIDSDYKPHEIYYYLGISSIVICVFSLLFQRNSKLKVYSFLLLWAFLILGLLRYLPLIHETQIPIVSLFRYWGRSAILVSLSSSLLAANFIDEKENPKLKKSNLFFIFLPVLYLLFLTLFNLQDEHISRIIRFFTKGGYNYPSNHVYLWFFVFLMSVLTLAFYYYKHKNYTLMGLTTIKVGVAVLILLDLFYFSRPVLADLYTDVRSVKAGSDEIELQNKRTIYYDDNVYGNQNLYYKRWGLFGYSQLVDPKYSSELLKAGLKYKKTPNPVETSDYPQLANLGVYALYYPKDPLKSVYLYNSDPFSLEDKSIESRIIIKKEGYLKIEVTVPTTVYNIHTFIRNYPGWKISIDGIRTAPSSLKDDLFVSFYVPSGKHTLELTYVPIHLVYGMFSSLSLLILTLAVSHLVKHKKITTN